MRMGILTAIMQITLSPTPGLVDAADPPWIVRSEKGVVAADSKEASEAGAEMLRAGGNAIDAAVATSFALAVTRPYSTGLGGGGFLVARFADGHVVAQDFRETAPAAATTDMFIAAAARNPDGPSVSEFGPLAVAVPGLVAGRCQILALHGTLPLSRTLAPAIRLARVGCVVDADYVRVAKEVLELYGEHPSLKESCGYVYRVFLNGGRLLEAGDTLRQPALADLLEGLALNGPDFFYKGPLARAIVESMKKRGGLITESDLAAYQPKLREPLQFTYRHHEIITMPLPSSGGIALAETLNILEASNYRATAKSNPPLATHLQIEAMKHAFADRAQWLGDEDFSRVPKERLLSPEYAKALARLIEPDRAGDVRGYGSDGIPKDAGTSHFCVADRFGNVVVSTETINTEFGSLMAIDGWGLVLNNEMDDFTADPDKPNAFGLKQSRANAVEPGKKPLSSMTPTIVLRNEQPLLLVGASGGPRIITSVLNVILGVIDLDCPIADAMQRPRPHHQWRPDEVFFDQPTPQQLSAELARRGHAISPRRRTGIVQAIVRTTDGWIAASDPRKGGQPAAE